MRAVLSLISGVLRQTRGAITKDFAMKRLMSAVMIAPIFALFLAVAAGPARAQALRDDAHVTDMLVAAQVGDILRNTCPQVSARMFVVLAEMLALENHAKAAGNDTAVIRAFLKSPDEKARIKTLADDYLAKAGALPGDVGSYCTAARAEIAAKTTAGKLIKISG